MTPGALTLWSSFDSVDFGRKTLPVVNSVVKEYTVHLLQHHDNHTAAHTSTHCKGEEI